MKEKRELFRRERDVTAVPIHRMTQGVDDEVADDDPRSHDSPRRLVSAQAGEQLAEVERLGQIVVGAGIEAGNSVLDRVERGQRIRRMGT